MARPSRQGMWAARQLSAVRKELDHEYEAEIGLKTQPA